MQFENAARPGAQVQRVDVLRGEREVAGERLQPRERVVTGIRPRAAVRRQALVVPPPHQHRIPVEALRRGKLLDAAAAPQSAGSAKRRKAALRRDAGSREHEERTSGAQTRDERFHRPMTSRAAARESAKGLRPLAERTSEGRAGAKRRVGR